MKMRNYVVEPLRYQVRPDKFSYFSLFDMLQNLADIIMKWAMLLLFLAIDLKRIATWRKLL